MAGRRIVKKRECSIVSFETDLGTNRYLEFDNPAFHIMHYITAPLANGPHMVAYIGGIPEELKIEGGISYSVPCPTLKLPKSRYLPQHPILRERALRRAYEETMVETDFRNTENQAYATALRIYNQSKKDDEEEEEGLHKVEHEHEHEQEQEHEHEQLSPPPTLLQVICKQLEENEGLIINFNQLPQAMIEVNLPPPPPPLPLPLLSVHPAAREENGGGVKVKHVYSLHTIESPHVTRQYLKRDYGDGFDLIILRKIIVNEPEVVAAVGGIPDELKIEGAISFTFPFPILNFTTTPTKNRDIEKVLRKSYTKAVLKYDTKNAFLDAYSIAIGLRASSSSISEHSKKRKARDMDRDFCIMAEVNLAKPILSIDQIPPKLRWIFWK